MSLLSRRAAIPGLLLLGAAAPPPRAFYAVRHVHHATDAVIWLHGSYDSAHKPPETPAFLRRMKHTDIYRLDRAPGTDRISDSVGALAERVRALRATHYRQIAVAGHSRGAWVALGILQFAGLVDAVGAFSPAAHGDNPIMHDRAMDDFSTLLAAAKPGSTRLLYATFRDDPLDLDPPARITMIRDTAARTGYRLSVIAQPAKPTGHDAIYDHGFNPALGGCAAGVLAGTSSC